MYFQVWLCAKNCISSDGIGVKSYCVFDDDNSSRVAYSNRVRWRRYRIVDKKPRDIAVQEQKKVCKQSSQVRLALLPGCHLWGTGGGMHGGAGGQPLWWTSTVVTVFRSTDCDSARRLSCRWPLSCNQYKLITLKHLIKREHYFYGSCEVIIIIFSHWAR